MNVEPFTPDPQDPLAHSEPSLALYRLGRVELLSEKTAASLDQLEEIVGQMVVVQKAREGDRKLLVATIINSVVAVGSLSGLIGVLVSHVR